MPSSKRPQKIAICILLALAILFLSIGCFFTLHQKSVILKFQTPEIEPGAIKIPATETPQAPETAETPEGGSSGSVSYSDQVSIDLSTRSISLMFQNPSESGADMILHLLIGDQEIAATGLLKEGYRLQTLPLAPSVEVETGDYKGSFVVDHYNPDTGEKYIFKLNIDTDVHVG